MLKEVNTNVKFILNNDVDLLTKAENYYCQAKVNAVEKTWVPKLQLLSKFLYLEALHVKRSRDTKIPQSSGPPVKIGDEAVHKELGDRMERAATIASSLEAEQDSVNAARPNLVLPVQVNAAESDSINTSI
ncbi:hypothetical protein Tco_1534087 [Tanacetum coccineum]